MALLIGLLVIVTTGIVYEAWAARYEWRLPPPGRMVDVGGYYLHLLCSGSGSPTVVLDAGLGDSSLVWAKVQAQMARSQRVCAFDRAGIAWSEPGLSPRSPQRAVDELHALLVSAGESPPYVLVGHSAGVNNVRLFAAAHPELVQGLVLVEPPLLQEVSPTFVNLLVFIRQSIGVLARVGVVRLLGKVGLIRVLFGGAEPPDSVASHAGLLYRPQSIQASIAETRALPEVIAAVNRAATPGAWGNWPVRIVAAYQGATPKQNLVDGLQQLAQLSSRGEVITVQGSHFVHFEHPDVIAEAIQEVSQGSHDH